MTVNVKFDDRTWGRLATLADQQDTTIVELLERAAHRLLTGTAPSPRPGGEPTRMDELRRSREAHKRAITSEVVRLRGRGHTIAAIADIVGYSTTYVSRILCDNGRRTWKRDAA